MTNVLYAYRFTRLDDPDRARLLAERGCPNTGWTHAGGGPPFRVVVSEDPEQLAQLKVPGTTVEVYTGDEPTIPFREWVPAGWRGKAHQVAGQDAGT